MGRFAVAAFLLFMLQLGFEHAEGQNRISATKGGDNMKVSDQCQDDQSARDSGTSTSSDLSCDE